MKQQIIQRLHELSESITERHGWAVLKSYIEAIDEVIAAGVKTKAVEEALAELGLDLAPTSLRSALYRYRRKQKTERLNATSQRAMPQESVQQEPGKIMDIKNENEPTASIETNRTRHSSPITGDEKELFSRFSPIEKV